MCSVLRTEHLGSNRLDRGGTDPRMAAASLGSGALGPGYWVTVLVGFGRPG